jgi:hypothetical protein
MGLIIGLFVTVALAALLSGWPIIPRCPVVDRGNEKPPGGAVARRRTSSPATRPGASPPTSPSLLKRF